MHGGDIYTREIDLDFSVNVNPYGASKRVLEALAESLKDAEHYPDIEQTRARESLAALEELDKECIICGNGASELIMAVTRAVNPKKALIISPGFYGYIHALSAASRDRRDISASSMDDVIVQYQLNEQNGFKLEEDILNYIECVDMIYLTNPHNPTGRLIDHELLTQIISKASGMGCTVLLDECFLRLTKSGSDLSFKKKVTDFPNLYVIDAFTKLFAMPGIRAGYLVSCAENIARVKSQLPEWNLSTTSEALLVAGAEELQKTDFISKNLEMIQTERDYLRQELTSLGIYVNESDTNFLLIRLDEKPDKEKLDRDKLDKEKNSLYEKLLERRILIRSCADFRGLGKGWYRVAVRSHKDNIALVETIRETIKRL